MMNKLKIFLIASTLVLSVGCSDTSQVQSNNKINTNNEINNEVINENNEVETSDKELLASLGYDVMDYISEGSGELFNRMRNEDLVGLSYYAIKINESQYRVDIENKFNEVLNSLTTDEGISALNDLRNVYDDYMSAINNFTEGIYDYDTSQLIINATENIPIITQKILDM